MIRLPVCVTRALALVNGGISTTIADLPYWSCDNITEVGQLICLVI